MKQIDEQGYKDGGDFFNKGKSLRSVIEPMMESMDNIKTMKEGQVAEAYNLGIALGFADAFLTKLRSR